MIAVDTNILIYAHRGETTKHAVANANLVRLAEGSSPWALPIFCVSEFLRVVTHRRVFNPPTDVAVAIEFLEQLLCSPSCRVALPGDEFIHYLTDVLTDTDARGNLVFDAQIVALCCERGIPEILTTDRDFDRFRQIRATYL